ncbi:MAG: zf-HC2 domain-containing protein, partial [Chromatiales bacterium]
MDTCREISALVSRAMDTRLPFGERVRVRLHLAICSACRQFSRHMQILRRATRQLRQRAEKGAMP